MDKKELRKKINKCILVSISIVLAMLTCGGAFLAHYSNKVVCIPHNYANIGGRILSSITLLMLAWLIISVSYRYVRKGRIIIICFLAVFITGININKENHTYCSDGDLQDVDLITNILAPINSTLSVLFPSRGAYSEIDNSHREWKYHTYHLMNYFFISALLFSLLGRRFLNRSWHWLYLERKKNIFWGYSENGRTLAESFQGYSIFDRSIFVLSRVDNNKTVNELNDDDYIFDKVNRIGAVVLYDDYDKIKRMQRRYSGRRHFFMTDDQDFNVKMALQVLDILGCSGVDSKKHLYIRTELDNVDKFITELLVKYNLSGKVEVRLYNHSDLTARLFVKDNPIIKHPSLYINKEECSVEGNMNVLILGLGWTGLELLKKTVCDAQFLGEKYKFSLTVIDRE